MDSKLIQLEKALLVCQQEIAKYKSQEAKLNGAVSQKVYLPKAKKQKTLGLKRSNAAVYAPKAEEEELEDLEDAQENDY